MLSCMDALMLLNTEATRAETTGIDDLLGDLVARVRGTGGVLALISAPVAPGADEMPESVFGVTEQDLALVSASADAFDGVDDLAAGLHDMGIDRIVIAGVDIQGSIMHTAMAGLACNFDIIVLADATLDLSGEPVDWLATAEAEGTMVRSLADLWLRM